MLAQPPSAISASSAVPAAIRYFFIYVLLVRGVFGIFLVFESPAVFRYTRRSRPFGLEFNQLVVHGARGTCLQAPHVKGISWRKKKAARQQSSRTTHAAKMIPDRRKCKLHC